MAYLGSKAQAGRGSQISIGPAAGATAPTGITGTTTVGSPTITAASSIVGVVAGLSVTGTGIPAGTTVISATGTTITLSQNATAAGTAVSLTFTVGYVTIGEIKSAPPVEGKFDKEDVSNFQSGVDKEYIKLMRDNGAPKITGNRVSSDAGQLATIAAYNDPNNAYMFQVTLPKTPTQTTTGDTYTYNALVLGQSFVLETNKATTFTLDLQITGPVTFTAGA